MAQRLSTPGALTDRLRTALGENINIDIVNQSYTTTYGVAVRAESVDRDALQIAGIVQGVNASIVAPDAGSERQLRRSNLTVEVLQQNESQATLRIELRDNETGAPIVLSDPDRRYPIGGSTRNGYITVAEQRVETNASGVAIVTIDEPGIFTARYHPLVARAQPRICECDGYCSLAPARNHRRVVRVHFRGRLAAHPVSCDVLRRQAAPPNARSRKYLPTEPIVHD